MLPSLIYLHFSIAFQVTVWAFLSTGATEGHCCQLLPWLPSTWDLEQVLVWGFLLARDCHLPSGYCQVSTLPVIPGGQAAVRMLWHLSTGFSLLGGLKSKISCINFQSDGGFLRFQGQEKSDVYPLQGFSILTAFALCRDLLPSSSLSFKRLIGVIRAACWNCQEHDMLKCGTRCELGSSSLVLGKHASY